MADEKIDPEKTRKVINLLIAILTAIGGFLSGMGSAHAMNIIF